MVRTILGIVAGLVMGLAGVFLFMWLLWWLWTRHDEEEEAPAIELKDSLAPVEEPLRAEPEGVETIAADEEPAEAPPVGDDLRRIEGIGPKLASVLGEAGIRTFAALADTDVGRLEQILQEADPRLLRLANPGTWPEQAALAAAGDWEALEALQNELKASRRV
jgi:predicted flap endonuclease-1-like 5' DNA nuclease